MFMDFMIAPINGHSISYTSLTKQDSRNTQVSIFLFKKNQIFGFSWCINREDLSIDVSITTVGLILTKLK